MGSREEIEARRILEHPLVNRDKLFQMAGINKNKYWNNKYNGTKIEVDYWRKIITSYKNLTKDLRSL